MLLIAIFPIFSYAIIFKKGEFTNLLLSLLLTLLLFALSFNIQVLLKMPLEIFLAITVVYILGALISLIYNKSKIIKYKRFLPFIIGAILISFIKVESWIDDSYFIPWTKMAFIKDYWEYFSRDNSMTGFEMFYNGYGIYIFPVYINSILRINNPMLIFTHITKPLLFFYLCLLMTPVFSKRNCTQSLIIVICLALCFMFDQTYARNMGTTGYLPNILLVFFLTFTLINEEYENLIIVIPLSLLFSSSASLIIPFIVAGYAIYKFVFGGVINFCLIALALLIGATSIFYDGNMVQVIVASIICAIIWFLVFKIKKYELKTDGPFFERLSLVVLISLTLCAIFPKDLYKGIFAVSFLWIYANALKNIKLSSWVRRILDSIWVGSIIMIIFNNSIIEKFALERIDWVWYRASLANSILDYGGISSTFIIFISVFIIINEVAIPRVGVKIMKILHTVTIAALSTVILVQSFTNKKLDINNSSIEWNDAIFLIGNSEKNGYSYANLATSSVTNQMKNKNYMIYMIKGNTTYNQIISKWSNDKEHDELQVIIKYWLTIVEVEYFDYSDVGMMRTFVEEVVDKDYFVISHISSAYYKYVLEFYGEKVEVKRNAFIFNA